MLELPPADALQQLDELMRTLGEREPHLGEVRRTRCATRSAASARWPWPGTCRRCSCTRTAATNCLTSPAPPLSIEATAVESRQFQIDGGLRVCTDGLRRGKQGQEHQRRARPAVGVFGPSSRPGRWRTCPAALDGVYSDRG